MIIMEGRACPRTFRHGVRARTPWRDLGYLFMPGAAVGMPMEWEISSMPLS
jgi:hypothetical protein